MIFCLLVGIVATSTDRGRKEDVGHRMRSDEKHGSQK